MTKISSGTFPDEVLEAHSDCAFITFEHCRGASIAMRLDHVEGGDGFRMEIPPILSDVICTCFMEDGMRQVGLEFAEWACVAGSFFWLHAHHFGYLISCKSATLARSCCIFLVIVEHYPSIVVVGWVGWCDGCHIDGGFPSNLPFHCLLYMFH